jgi:DNA-binding NtrC family response regulator
MSLPQPHSLSTVLVVEDDEILRMCTANFVADAGFIPVEAANADEAVAILESRSDIALVFTDIQMPGSMDGLGLARTVHDRWPAIKIILVSGQVGMSECERPVNSRFFQKPFAIRQMIEGLQDMIRPGKERSAQRLTSLRSASR